MALVLALPVVAGCGDSGGGTTAEEPPERLLVIRDDGVGNQVEVPLECEGGDREVCARIARALPALVEDPDEVCTEVYGGPETIALVGRLGGREIDLTIGREDGCAIARYDRLEEVLGS